MQKQRILRKISKVTVVGLLLVQLFGVNLNKPANAVGVGNVNITNYWDVSTISKIYPPHAVVQLGKWKFSPINDDVILTKLTFQTVDPASGAVLNNLHTFSSLYLYEGNNLLGVASYVNGDVVFDGIFSIISADSYKTFTLKADTTDSGQFNSNVRLAFVIKSDNNADMQIRGAQTGELLGSNQINYNLFSDNGPAELQFARSTVYNFHDAFPVVTAISLGNNLPIQSVAKIFKFTITNGGTRNLRIGKMVISHVVSGLAPTGNISNFGLYQDDGTGGLLMPALAQNNTIVNMATPNPVLVSFNNLNNLVVAPGASKTFIVAANTTHALDGKTIGSVIVSSKIAGSTGWNGSSWNNGDLYYFYTSAVQYAKEQGPYRHSDSYEVQSNYLIYTL